MRLERFGFRAMGSPCEIKLWCETRAEGAQIAKAGVDEVLRLEAKFSRYRPESLASRINASAGDPRGIEIDDETGALLDFAQTAYTESDGRFDPTSGVLRRVWDFKSGRLPNPEDLEATRSLVGWEKVDWQRPRIALSRPGMELDFGGFVKEYAADRTAELCRGLGARSGIVDLGGDLAVIGPHPDGAPWLVGIRDPRAPESVIARITVFQGGLATSGDYERFMIIDGVRYSHLLDPRTGESHRGGLACVSVCAPHCLVAGVSSTIGMLYPSEQAPEFLESLSLPHLMVDAKGVVSGSVQEEGRSAPPAQAASSGPGALPHASLPA